jgi:hypothetical protein
MESEDSIVTSSNSHTLIFEENDFPTVLKIAKFCQKITRNIRG